MTETTKEDLHYLLKSALKDLKTLDDSKYNKTCFAAAQRVHSEVCKERRAFKKEIETLQKANTDLRSQLEDAQKPKNKKLSEEERAEAVEAFLDSKLLDKTISAAEIAQLKDILNLKQRDRDVIIQIVNYGEAGND